ncbi:hypothetical protein XFF6990_120071 [Xanthomonas citri pv. fuscans]|uniref:Transposase n=2 Tax=Xanthomonas TaxID=338 RepID=A0A7Z7NH86_XANCH|nr:hypothetical protein XFF6990_120071 [Xanthomonas citri pv. fuscans]SOO23880.1 hypothetical protein XFF6991_310050 [Xanthomonas phaseoli pv. phaseoli]
MPAHRRGTLGGMNAATELTGTYLQRVLRRWAGKGPQQTRRPHALQAKQLMIAGYVLSGTSANASVSRRAKRNPQHRRSRL